MGTAFTLSRLFMHSVRDVRSSRRRFRRKQDLTPRLETLENQHHRWNQWYEEGPLKGPLGLTDPVLTLVYFPRGLHLLSRVSLAISTIP
jgi:hypothetical protein